ncbi:MAG TPA: preprotein translocase subunit SecA, partial [Bacteroidales bacterium]|nr:preprotein translocase subunit SecA [Bacteroidales bacterium]
MLSVLKKVFGDKSTKDLKDISPYVGKVKDAYNEIENLTNDELRTKTAEFKKRIAEYIQEEENEIANLKESMDSNPDMDVDEKEENYLTIDKLTKKSYEKTQEVLNQLLPEAFSVMKETARRFVQNEVVEVTANEFDRELGANQDSVNIKGDKAYYNNN